jgi:homoserine O-acetyltransferase
MLRLLAAAVLAASAVAASAADAPPPPAPALPTTEGDYVAHDFKFTDGETLKDLRLHYTTLGKPHRDRHGQVDNAVMVLHGTGGDGHQFIRPIFSGVLFVPGGVLDANKYFIILPDGIGHGKSSKPSDGLHAKFPHYDYDDMVRAQYLLATQGLHVNHLRLVMGTSMGCMHSFVWAETYPDFIDAAMPLACLPVQIAGRNRIWRKMIAQGITNDPAYQGGEYKSEPQMGLRIAIDFLLMAGTTPLLSQKAAPTRDAADTYLDDFTKREMASLDANDFLYQIEASRNYDPSAKLGTIKAPVMWVNSADDFINPPDLGIAEVQVKNIPHGTFVLIPSSDKTHGHGTHTWAAVWQDHLAELLKVSAR